MKSELLNVKGFAGIVPAETMFEKKFNSQPPTIQQSIREVISKINESMESAKLRSNNIIVYMAGYNNIFAKCKVCTGDLDYVYDFIMRAYELNGYTTRQLNDCEFIISW